MEPERTYAMVLARHR